MACEENPRDRFPLCQSVIFGNLTLRRCLVLILERNAIFQKIELSISCSSFWRQLKISERE